MINTNSIRNGLLAFVLTGMFLFLINLGEDIGKNKLLNISKVHNLDELKQSIVKKTDSQFELVFNFESIDNHLGALEVLIGKPSTFNGSVEFELFLDGNSIVRNQYDLNFFTNSGFFPFGFPIIENSKNKVFVGILRVKGAEEEEATNILNANSRITSKYVYPRSEILSKPHKLIAIAYARGVGVISRIEVIKYLLTSATVATIVWVVSSGTTRARTMQKISPIDSKAMGVINRFKLNPFILPMLAFVVLTIHALLGNFSSVEKWSSTLYILLLISVVVVLSGWIFKWIAKKRFFDSVAEVLIAFLDQISEKKYFIFCAILVVLAAHSRIYYLGGDDSRMFYFEPGKFLYNYASKIVSDTGLSSLINFIPPTTLVPLSILMQTIKTAFPFVNLQSSFGVLNLLLGLYFHSKLSKYLVGTGSRWSHALSAITAFMYVFSVFNFYTLLNSRLLTMYLISVFPASIYLVIRSVSEGRLHLMLLVVLIWSTLGIHTIGFPVAAAAIITSLPVVVFKLRKLLKRLFIYSTISGFLLVILSFHWLVNVPHSTLITSYSSDSASISSESFRKQNQDGIELVSRINNSFFPLTFNYHEKIQKEFGWPQLKIYDSWYKYFVPLGAFSALIILFVGYRNLSQKNYGLFGALLLSVVLSIYFFTVNVTQFGSGAFLWLSNNIPGFVVFRNMYDKFSYSLAFSYTLLLFLSLDQLFNNKANEKIKKYLILVFVLIAIIYSKPFLFGEFTSLPYWGSKNSFEGISDFNSDFKDMLKFIESSDTNDRYLSLPLQSGNSLLIEGSSSRNHFYSGVSPLLILTGKNDLSGLLSFQGNEKEVYNTIKSKDFDKFGKILKRLNVGYVILFKEIPSDLQNSSMYSDGLYGIQDESFYKSIVGEKVADFGSKYSIHKIKPEYYSPKIYFESQNGLFTPVIFSKLSPEKYSVTIPNVLLPGDLIFLDPFLPGWTLKYANSNNTQSSNHFVANGYANGWYLDAATDAGRTGDSQDLRIIFSPKTTSDRASALSLATYVLLCAWITFKLLTSKSKT